MRLINDAGLALLKQWEGLRLNAYLDTGGVWTIGYGHTKTAREGMEIDAVEAERLLREDLRDAQSAVERLVTVPLTDNQHGALVSFVFNIGETQFRGSTLLKRLNAGRYGDVPAQLARWKYDNGRVIDGLVNRRAAEAGLWAKGAFVSSGSVSAAPAPVSKVLVNRETLTTAAAASSGVLTALSGLTGPMAYAAAAVVAIAGLAAVIVIAKRNWDDG